MSPLVFAGIVPHPPLLIEGVGDDLKEGVAATHQGFSRLAAELVRSGPETVVVITPHGPLFSDAYTIAGWTPLQGDFAPFGATVAMSWPNDLDYALAAEAVAAQQDLPLVVINARELASHGRGASLDHGAMVPLYYLRQAGWQGQVVCVRIGGLPPRQCYQIGKVLAEVAAQRPVAILASGDLSHCLSNDGPSPYNPAGARFDEQVVGGIREDDFASILAIPPELRQRAAECGWRPLVTLLGAVDGLACCPRVLSYQGPYGVGYLVATLNPGDPAPGRKLVFPASKPVNGTTPVQLARAAIRHYLATGERLQPPSPLAPPLDKAAGAFVSLKLDDQLRGCMGTLEPSEQNLAREIIANAITAATGDPRFEPVTTAELDELLITVDVLAQPQPAEFKDLDPTRLGLVVEWKGRRGLLLPDLPGVDSARQQIEIACQKAGIPVEKWQEARLYSFTVERYK